MAGIEVGFRKELAKTVIIDFMKVESQPRGNTSDIVDIVIYC